MGRKRCPDFAQILRGTSPDSQIKKQVANCFYEELHRMARSRCKNAALAEDAAHDSLINAMESLGTFRGDAPIEAWLRRLVSSACHRLQRGRKNDPAYNLPLDEAPKPADADTGETGQEMALLVHERVLILKEALTDIAEPNRTMFLLHEGQDMSLADLSKRFDLTVESVKARLKRTRMKLRTNLIHRAESEE